jgi:hypothetical protein
MKNIDNNQGLLANFDTFDIIYERLFVRAHKGRQPTSRKQLRQWVEGHARGALNHSIEELTRTQIVGAGFSAGTRKAATKATA